MSIGGYSPPFDLSSSVLSEDDVVMLHRFDGTQHLHLLVADRVGIECHGGFHRSQCQQLCQVVLHHVAERARLLVIPRASFNAKFLGHGNLHALDTVAVP